MNLINALVFVLVSNCAYFTSFFLFNLNHPDSFVVSFFISLFFAFFIHSNIYSCVFSVLIFFILFLVDQLTKSYVLLTFKAYDSVFIVLFNSLINSSPLIITYVMKSTINFLKKEED